jgi:hypothetical protein
VQLVDEGDDLAVAALDLVEDGLEALLELPPVLRAGDHRPHVERDERLALQGGRHVALDDAPGEALDDGGLADAGLADEHGVVLGTARQHLDGAAHLLIAADDGVDLALASTGSEVDAELLQRLEGLLRVAAGHAGTALDLVEGVHESGGRGPLAGQEVGDARAAVLGECHQQVLGADELVASLFRERLGRAEHAVGGLAELRRGHARAAGRGKRGDGGPHLGGEGADVGADGREQRGGDALPLLEEGVEEVEGLHLGIAVGGRHAHGCAEGVLALGGELDVHVLRPSLL